MNLIKTLLREGLLSENTESVEDFYHRHNDLRQGNEFLSQCFKNPKFEFRLAHNGGVIHYDNPIGMFNKCETNTFNFIKNRLENDDGRFYPVAGFAFTETTGHFEHFWVYDEVRDLFIEVTPFIGGDKLSYGYGGIINKNINQDILNAKTYQDIDFLKGKTHYWIGRGLEDNEVRVDKPNYVKSDKSEDEMLFDFIRTNSNYEELSGFIGNNVSTKKELHQFLPKLQDLQSNVRNNREFNLYGKIMNQINTILNFKG